MEGRDALIKAIDAEIERRELLEAVDEAISLREQENYTGGKPVTPSPTSGALSDKSPRDRWRGVKRGARNMASGMASLLDVVASPIREGLKATGLRIPTLDAEIEKLTPHLSPQTRAEVYEDVIGKSLGSMIASGGVGGALGGASGRVLSGIGQLMKMGTSPTVSNASTQAMVAATHQALLDEGLGEGGAMAGSMIASSLPGLLKGSTVVPGIGALASVDKKRLRHFRESGIQPTLGDISLSPFVRSVQKFGDKLPFVPKINGEEFHAARRGQIERALGVDSPLGTSEVGDILSKEARSRILRQKDVQKKAYERAESQIPVGAQADLSSLLSKYEAKRGSLTNPEVSFDGGTFGKFLASLGDIKNTRKIGIHDLGELTKHYRLQARKADAYGSDVSADAGSLKALAQDLASARSDALKDLGGKAYSYLKRADSLTRRVAPYKERLSHYADLGEIKGAEVERAIPKLLADLKVGGRDLKEIMKSKSLSDSVTGVKTRGDKSRGEKVLDTVFASLGTDKTGNFNAGTFLSNYKKLGDGVSALKSVDMSRVRAKKLDSVIKAIEHMKETSAEANFSNTAAHHRLSSPHNLMSYAVGSIASQILNRGLLHNKRLLSAIESGFRVKSTGDVLRWRDRLRRGFDSAGIEMPPECEATFGDLLRSKSSSLLMKGVRSISDAE